MTEEDEHYPASLELNEHEVLDAIGLLCPEPVMLLHKIVKKVGAAAVIKVIADDPSTTRDIPRFCEFLRHELMHQCETEFDNKKQYIYWIKTRVS